MVTLKDTLNKKIEDEANQESNRKLKNQMRETYRLQM